MIITKEAAGLELWWKRLVGPTGKKRVEGGRIEGVKRIQTARYKVSKIGENSMYNTGNMANIL